MQDLAEKPTPGRVFWFNIELSDDECGRMLEDCDIHACRKMADMLVNTGLRERAVFSVSVRALRQAFSRMNRLKIDKDSKDDFVHDVTRVQASRRHCILNWLRLVRPEYIEKLIRAEAQKEVDFFVSCQPRKNGLSKRIMPQVPGAATALTQGPG